MNDSNPSQPPLVRGGENSKKLDLKFIPYNKKLIPFARELRRNRTESEIIFWDEIIKNQEILKYKFTQQKMIDNFIIDFYCSKLLLAIEIDGGIHDKLKNKDKERSDVIFYKYGIKVIRCENKDILSNIENIIKNLENEIILRESFLFSGI